MSCSKLCHDPYCYNDSEHFCHDWKCNPAEEVLSKMELYFRDLVKNNESLSVGEVKEVWEKITYAISKT
jgi:hypothetical protein